jgi:putative transposase
MPSHARIVIPEVPHHVTQRGNRRQRVFFGDEDKAFYLRLLLKYSEEAQVALWAYCIMDNHIHVVAVPSDEMGLAKTFGNTHKFYTKTINERHEWKGYLWQGRFFSFPMDDCYLYNAVRYIETNPVRAKLVRNAREWKYSSAKAHIEKSYDPLLQPSPLEKGISDWEAYLQSALPKSALQEFRVHTKSGLPLGSEEFLQRLEKITGLPMIKKRPGPKGKQ